ncbi:efflux transporter outer membrane subunit [Acanthopleuribacter pedis]|uniref:Efflux transporter outer membrane subunit n=1 Tax=Acanthopleuribacter pedis TaxID=442870 RepID=A0A8J7QDR5_9BACT|nr:efflux transporter outer membrane subunit [Acanthopleuribacter pedis]MBO1317750.1 efflux transporter outer membrane subunit [Acanthopleuribacter pedis]
MTLFYHSRPARLVTFALLAATSAACSLHQVNENVVTPATVPDQFHQEPSSEQKVVSQPRTAPWWRDFNDDELDGLMDQLLAENLDLRASWARLRQAQQLAAQSRAAFLPNVTGNGSASRSKSLFVGQEALLNDYRLNATVSYEVDLWKRLSQTARATQLDAMASREDTEALAQSLSANLARTWFGVVEQHNQLQLLNEQKAVSQNFLKVVELRFGQALSSAVDVYQQRRNLASIEAQIPTAQQQLQLGLHQLAVLLGQTPGSMSPDALGALADVDPLPRLGLPADLLQHRPDVRAAALRLTAADYRVGVAIANRFPSLTLSGEPGFQATDLSDLFSNWVWRIAGNITGPIFDAGRRKAEVERQRAVLEAAISSYEQTVLTALREVEDAALRDRTQRAFLETLVQQRTHAEKALEAAQSRYVRGVGNYLTVLTELSALQNIQRTELTAKRTLLDHRVSLHLALGGLWSREIKAMEPVQKVRGTSE